MAATIDDQIARIAADRESGASEIHRQVLELFRSVLLAGTKVEPVAEKLVRAQPSMAPVWNAARQALSARADLTRFDRYIQQVIRAPGLLARHATALLQTQDRTPLRVVTISFSGTVVLALEAIAAAQPVEVACAEGQPALEGRRMAERLATSGLRVTYFSDAALANGLDRAEAVVVGADAVTPGWFLNKSGTRMLAAAAAQQGIPLYVLATRDKFLSGAIGGRLAIKEGAPDEIWPSPPPGVTVRNPYFERVPLDLVAAVITDMGVLGAALVPNACDAGPDAELLALVPPAEL